VSDRPVDLISDNVDCVIRGGELTDPRWWRAASATWSFVTVASPDYLKQRPCPGTR
jgi:DNA-binding transcriptional LysR family regulator